jgi:hypothetical protein
MEGKIEERLKEEQVRYPRFSTYYLRFNDYQYSTGTYLCFLMFQSRIMLMRPRGKKLL